MFEEGGMKKKEKVDNSQISVVSGQWETSQVHTLPFLTDAQTFVESTTSGEIQFKGTFSDLSSEAKELVTKGTEPYSVQAGFYWFQR
jgi:hypothetical protein